VEDTALGAADAFAAAAALAPAMADEQFDLILTGLQSDDQGHAQFGPVLATRLGVPHSTIIMEVVVENGALRVKRELEGGWFQHVSMPLPALLTIQSGINQLRYATLKGIMAAKKKEIKKVTLAGSIQSRQKVLALYHPTKAKQTVMIGGSPAEAAKELVRRLREEARVL
jgi:electron transfer flavoprotein beta subunit